MEKADSRSKGTVYLSSWELWKPLISLCQKVVQPRRRLQHWLWNMYKRHAQMIAFPFSKMPRLIMMMLMMMTITKKKIMFEFDFKIKLYILWKLLPFQYSSYEFPRTANQDSVFFVSVELTLRDCKKHKNSATAFLGVAHWWAGPAQFYIFFVFVAYPRLYSPQTGSIAKILPFYYMSYLK